MNTQRFHARRTELRDPEIGLLLLSTDETLEQETRLSMQIASPYDPANGPKIHTSRVKSSPEVTEETLAAMESTITEGAEMLPEGPDYAVIGYGCTSATAVLGAERVTELVQAGRETRHVTTPLVALLAYCSVKQITRLAVLSPYVPEVSERLVSVLEQNGITVTALGTFDEPNESAVVRIDADDIVSAGDALLQNGAAEALFLSCTNLPTVTARAKLTDRTDLPILSSNLVLMWDMARLAGLDDPDRYLRG